MNEVLGLKLLNFIYVPFVSLLVFLDLEESAIMGLTVLLVIDMITGVWKTIALGEKPKSWRFANGLLSKVVLLIVPFTLAIASKAVNIDLSAFVFIVIDALILSEMYSIFANIYSIRTKKKAEEFDVMSLILKKTRELINKVLNDA